MTHSHMLTGRIPQIHAKMTRIKCFYHAAHSLLPLAATCEALQIELGFPEFTFDAEDNWQYAWSEGEGKHLTVTKANDETTVAAWMSTCPASVNYQIILTAEEEPDDFASVLGKKGSGCVGVSRREVANARVVQGKT